MSNQQTYSILANYLVMRQSNINKNIVSKEEITRVTEQFIQMPGNDRKQSREDLVCGIRGWKSTIRRRKEEGKVFYTPASRFRKKLTVKTSWYKTNNKKNQKRKYLLDAVEKAEMRAMHKKKRDKKPPEEPGHGEHEESLGKNMKENPNHKNKTPYTTGRLVEAEENLLLSNVYKLKIVERSGNKLEDLLHK